MADAGSSKQGVSTMPPDDPRRKLAAVRVDDDQQVRHIGVVGDTYTILITSEDTADRYCLIDMVVHVAGRRNRFYISRRETRRAERRNRPRSGECPTSISQLLAVCSQNALHLFTGWSGEILPGTWRAGRNPHGLSAQAGRSGASGVHRQGDRARPEISNRATRTRVIRRPARLRSAL